MVEAPSYKDMKGREGGGSLERSPEATLATAQERCRNLAGAHVTKRVTVIIPSRTQPRQAAFLARAIRSVGAQTARSSYEVDVMVGLDPDAELPDVGKAEVIVHYANGKDRTQAAALNAAAASLDGDFVAFLEDDDLWHPRHLAISLQFLEHVGFASSTQLEVDGTGNVLRINDFPTPSGWVMSRSTWERVGAFNLDFRYHLDNEWLGRLAEAEVGRVHVMEATAPVLPSLVMQVRPWLANVVTLGGGRVRLVRHSSPAPNVIRLVHADSGMARIATDASMRKAADDERARLEARFGRVPW